MVVFSILDQPKDYTDSKESVYYIYAFPIVEFSFPIVEFSFPIV